MKNKTLAMMVAFSLLVSPAALAQGVKHERVFGVLDAEGTAQTVIDSVWLENKDGADTLTDATFLQDVETVKGQTSADKAGDTLTWKASGADVWYQGTSDKALPVTPVISCTLDGEKVTASEAKDRSGHLDATVAFAAADEVPHLILTGMMLPADQVKNVTVDNGFTFSDGSHLLIVGYGVTGVDSEDLPDHVAFGCDVEDFDPSDLFTVVTSEPLSRIRTELADAYGTASADATDALNGLSALADGSEITGDSDVTKLFAGIAQLSTGAASLKDGAGQLETGLKTLTENNDTLNSAASTVFDTLLAAATTQLQAAMPDLPALTQENWQTVLEGAMTSVSEDTIRAQATEQARAQVEEQVKKNEDEIRKQVEGAVQAKVLEGVLSAAGMNLTAEQYAQAVKAGQVTDDQSKQLEAAVAAQMATDEVKAQVESAVADTESQLVEQNLQSDEVQAKLNKQLEGVLAQAKAGYDQLSALDAQLTSYAQFQQGLSDYTSGVTAAQEGASKLSEGTSTLADGVEEMKTTLTDKLTPVLKDDVMPLLDKYAAAADQLTSPEHYDLVADGMDSTLMFILRTEW